ncbi:uncharacterized protein BXZ73DRAFT_109960 [Epithele typhae]|uniref:uncharacterized protein n=1 Tax=Epithele typhae TaxID=378194 RepID=UPI0020072BAD|nr:uncharacterized protein BXZ73DRAFT_109960 [Epithele typhae]KAH9908246.1 hypothetical protein BXZ73DRAFT_109960 [Epithele typhae]
MTRLACAELAAMCTSYTHLCWAHHRVGYDLGYPRKLACVDDTPGSSIEDGLNPEFPRNGSAFFSGTAASGSGDWKWLLTEGGHHTTFGGKQGFTRWPSTPVAPLYDGSGALASVVHQERGWAYVLFLRAGHLVPQGAPTAVFLVTPSFVSPPCVELPSAAAWR